MGPDQGYYIRICTEKTETEATLPISHEALQLCGEWGKGLVFKVYPSLLSYLPTEQNNHSTRYQVPSDCEQKATHPLLLALYQPSKGVPLVSP